MSTQPDASSGLRRVPEAVGAAITGQVAAGRRGASYLGGVLNLLSQVVLRLFRGVFSRAARLSRASLFEQVVRVGVRAIPIIALVQLFIGLILALNLAPTLNDFGMTESVADVVAIAIFRELGPLISAIVLSGFAGASIAAELGTMVEGEEIKALRAHALDPIRFLVVPRVLATAVMLVCLTVLADVIGTCGGFITSWLVLDVSPRVYWDRTRDILKMSDYITGLTKAGVFGIIIAGLACHEGLSVRGGAVGVGRATTSTVVKSIVCLIGADSVFTAIFYRLGW